MPKPIIAIPHRYTGKNSQHIGRHGVVKKNGVIWLNKQESEYLDANPSEEITRLSDAEAAKLTPPKLTGDNEPPGADRGVADEQAETAKALVKQKLDAKVEFLEAMDRPELETLCEQHNVKVEKKDKITDIINRLAPVMVKVDEGPQE